MILSIDDPVWDVAVFTKSRERPLASAVAECDVKKVPHTNRRSITVAKKLTSQ